MQKKNKKREIPGKTQETKNHTVTSKLSYNYYLIIAYNRLAK